MHDAVDSVADMVAAHIKLFKFNASYPIFFILSYEKYIC